MQSKVSMVMPCYNKAEYIGNMFDSIIAQKWDNLELVLVNDGSTDGTREIIAAYEPKFLARGFEVLTVDQENMGLPGAVYAGLKRITGDYVCQVDADDELDSKYVSALVGHLEQNPDCEWAACDMIYAEREGDIYRSYIHTATPEPVVMAKLAECYLLGRILDMVQRYMIRSSYLKRSGLLDNYYYDIRRTQEPQLVLTLAVAGGRLGYMKEPLYRYLHNDSMMSIRRTYEDHDRYDEQYYAIVEMTLQRINADASIKERLLALARYAKNKNRYYYCIKFGLCDSQAFHECREKLLEFANGMFSPSPRIANCSTEDAPYLMESIECNILGFLPGAMPIRPAGRVIAWGVLGIRGKRFLPILEASRLKPDELWDAAGDGITVKKPNICSLKADDLVIVLPKKYSEEICAALYETGCKHMPSDDLLSMLAPLIFPQFYDGSLAFTLEGV